MTFDSPQAMFPAGHANKSAKIDFAKLFHCLAALVIEVERAQQSYETEQSSACQAHRRKPVVNLQLTFNDPQLSHGRPGLLQRQQGKLHFVREAKLKP